MVVRILDLFRSGARRAIPTDAVLSRWSVRAGESWWPTHRIGGWRPIRALGVWRSRRWRSGRTWQLGSVVRSWWLAATVALVAAVLGALYAGGLQFGPAVAALLAGHAVRRYAVRTHPPGTVRRPVPDAPGYYYDPARAGPADRLLASVASRWLDWPVPAGGPVGRLLLVGLDGVEVEGSELAEDDPLYYLHRNSPGYVFASDDAAPSGR